MPVCGLWPEKLLNCRIDKANWYCPKLEIQFQTQIFLQKVATPTQWFLALPSRSSCPIFTPALVLMGFVKVGMMNSGSFGHKVWIWNAPSRDGKFKDVFMSFLPVLCQLPLFPVVWSNISLHFFKNASTTPILITFAKWGSDCTYATMLAHYVRMHFTYCIFPGIMCIAWCNSSTAKW